MYMLGNRRIEIGMHGKWSLLVRGGHMVEPNERMCGLRGILITSAANTLGISNFHYTSYTPGQREYMQDRIIQY